MGLFRKKSDDPNDLNALRAEIVDLKQRLDVADQQKADLLSKVDTVDQTNSVLYQRLDSLDAARAELDQRVGEVGYKVGEVDHRVGSVTELSTTVRSLANRLDAESTKVSPLPPPPPADTGLDDVLSRLDQLTASIADHNKRIDATQAAVSDADIARVEAEQARASELDAFQEQLRAATATSSEGQSDADDTVEVASAADVDVLQKQVGQMAEKMSALDNRMNKVSLELANQLTELSNDLDVLLEQDGDDTESTPSADDAVAANELVTEAIESVQRSTEKLAAEQARYEIQFRADLAELAERLRRPAAR